MIFVQLKVHWYIFRQMNTFAREAPLVNFPPDQYPDYPVMFEKKKKVETENEFFCF